ncbi:MAG TPA: hypothetical protein VF230_00290 [Acidimicrobiales bacterium]
MAATGGKLYGVDWRGNVTAVEEPRPAELVELENHPNTVLSGFEVHYAWRITREMEDFFGPSGMGSCATADPFEYVYCDHT